MKDKTPVAVTSRSFSKHPLLRSELLARYEKVTFNEDGRSLSGDALAMFLKGHSKAITALERIDEVLLAEVPELKVISKFGVGIDMVDLAALDRRGVLFAWAAGTNSRSVSELVLALAISLLRGLVAANAEVRSGTWKQAKGGTLSARTVGLVGLGRVGKDLVGLLKPFGCRILCHDVKPDLAFCKSQGVASADLDELLRGSDVVSLHLPLNGSTRGLLDAAKLALMKPGAILINTARGALIDEKALKERLESGALSGAACDVFAEEPPKDRELLALPNFIATPHIGGSTEEAILAMGRAAIAGLENARPAREFLKC